MSRRPKRGVRSQYEPVRSQYGPTWANLSQEKAEAEQILEHLPYSLALVDKNWHLIRWLGRAFNELCMEPGDHVQITTIIPDALRRWRDLSREEHSFRRELECVRADGTAFPAEVFVERLSDQDERWIVVIHDISERRHLEEEVRQAQKMEALGLLTSGIAHDLNNLFTIVLGHLDLADAELDGDHQVEQDLRGLRRQVADEVGGVVGRHLLQHVGRVGRV